MAFNNVNDKISSVSNLGFLLFAAVYRSLTNMFLKVIAALLILRRLGS